MNEYKKCYYSHIFFFIDKNVIIDSIFIYDLNFAGNGGNNNDDDGDKNGVEVENQKGDDGGKWIIQLLITLN